MKKIILLLFTLLAPQLILQAQNSPKAAPVTVRWNAPAASKSV